MKLLVIDDQLAVGRSIQMALAAEDFDVSVAGGGREGIALAQAGAFDAILLDIAMPEMDGFETLQVLKADTRLKGIPVIMISGWCDEGNVKKALTAGAAAFLVKPLKVEGLKRTVLEVIHKHQSKLG